MREKFGSPTKKPMTVWPTINMEYTVVEGLKIEHPAF